MEPGDPVDNYVGRRIRERRKIVGLTQQKLAVKLGLSFQQVQKYERGTNRVGASKLVQLSQALDVPISYFFEEIERDHGAETVNQKPAIDPHILSHAQVLSVVKCLIGIRDDRVRRRMIDLIQSVHDSQDQ
ncbi:MULTISPECIES: helix-turn-helix domain-containing protein [unclassified Iodidimonas]|jgi:transcriptional regulator with XRE-family HTH domain|uniref:helix-turn-helix domain-containing protein n=1 Tax=unclassified Iodidimonas TaxID=2626145 RepID=UPI0024827B82|nr:MULTISPECIES: helix-turn-helix domain-containing protein [unclassified Iodidimonas]